MATPGSPTTILPWRRRGDIVARPQKAGGRGGWVLKDPIASRYFTIREEEYFVWSRLNGAAATEALCRAFGERFAPQQLSLAELQRFVGQLIGQGLVVAENVGSASATGQRRAAQSRWGRLAGFNLLAIRFRGIDPDRLLDRLLPWCRGCFSSAGVAIGLFVLLSALALWLGQASEFARRWPEEAAHFTVRDVWSFAAVLIAVKVLHELGHALACKRFGGEVHEIGVLLLVFTPCLYCNVSDAWLLPSKWQRMAIGAAGMWVESVLTAVCAWLWWWSAPGWLHTTALQVVMVCGVSTLLFNINPLLRYDGYFILGDFLEVPNLQQQAWSELQRHVSGLLTGCTRPAPPTLSASMRRWLPLFAAASLAYRLTMVVAILWFLYRWLEPQGLGRIAQFMQFSTVAAMVIGPVMQIRQGWANRPRSIRPGTVIRVAVLMAVLTAIALVPLPCRVRAPIFLEPAAAQGVYATVDGSLQWIAASGTALQAGDEIARLENPLLKREIARLEGETDHARLAVVNLERRRLHDPQAALQLPGAQETEADVQEQLRQRRAEAERLVLRATQAGVLWPVQPRARTEEPHELRSWSDSPFDAQNAGCWVTAGTLLAQLGTERQLEAIAYLPQRDVPQLEVGQSVRLQLDAAPGRVIAGELAEVSVMQAERLAGTTALRLHLPLVAAPTGSRLVGTWYQARIRITEGNLPRLSHGGGLAAIVVAPRSLWQRAVQWWQETFPSAS